LAALLARCHPSAGKPAPTSPRPRARPLRRAPDLERLFTLAAERVLLARRLRRCEGVTALLVTGGLVLLVPKLSLSNPVVQGLGWGLVSVFTFALLAVMNRRWTASRTATDIAYRQNLLAAVSAHPASVIAALEPAYGIVLALAFLGEVPGPWTLAGGALIVAAAVTPTRRSFLATVGSGRRIR
jgi:drug/metabolite transporter (DMT)-like permease